MRSTRKISCDEATRLVSAGLDRELSPPARATLRLHFTVCTACKRFEQQMQLLRRALRGLDAGPMADDSSSAPAEPRPEPSTPDTQPTANDK